MRRRIAVFLFALSGVTPVLAQVAPPPEPAAAVPQMDTVVVSGEQPGPGLWKVSKGDHTLWVLGTLSPLPRDMHWKSHDVEAVISTAQEVIASPQVTVGANMGFFTKLTLLPSLIGVRNNPDGAMLKDVVPADLYAHWSVLKEKYIGRGRKVEKWRPIFAALDLYEAAIGKSGLTDSGLVQKTLEKAAKRAGLTPLAPQVDIAIDDPKAAVKTFKNTSLDDLDCFRKTLERIDSDLGTMVARANAWATGDLDTLHDLPYTDQLSACKAAITQTDLARVLGVNDIDARVEQAWVDAATSALAANRVTFAMLPIRYLLDRDGYLSRLRVLGYAVEEPNAASEDGSGTSPDGPAD